MSFDFCSSSEMEKKETGFQADVKGTIWRSDVCMLHAGVYGFEKLWKMSYPNGMPEYLSRILQRHQRKADTENIYTFWGSEKGIGDGV